MKTEVKLIQSKTDAITGSFRITVNGKDMYSPFTYKTFDEMIDTEKLAKAVAFDECCRAYGNVINYHSF